MPNIMMHLEFERVRERISEKEERVLLFILLLVFGFFVVVGFVV